MALAAEPRPADLPLPGGQAGATVRLTPLLSATMAAPPILARREGGRLDMLRALGVGVSRSDYVRVPIPAFLVEHPGAGRLLVDTGFHSAVAVEPKRGMGRMGGLIFKDIEMDPGQAVVAQLRDRDIDPASVRTVVMTHLHSDHASAIAEFPAATFVVSRAEWDAAAEGGERDGYIRRQFDHAFDYRTLDFESSDADSFASFGRAYDLFGDGSVRICFTPGHSTGHCSVVLRLGDREALLTGDAAFTMDSITESWTPLLMADEHRYHRSLREIALYIEQTPDALVIPGHDMDVWKTLQNSYG